MPCSQHICWYGRSSRSSDSGRVADRPKAEVQQVLGRAVLTLRGRADLTQQDVADGSGLHKEYVGSVERGERNMTVANLVKLCRGLGVQPSELLKEAEREGL